MSPTLPMLTSDRSQKAAGRRLRIVHDGHRSARPHRRRHPHLIKRTEIITRSNERSKMRGGRLCQGGSRLARAQDSVLTTQLAIFGMSAASARTGAGRVGQPYYMLSVGVKVPRNRLNKDAAFDACWRSGTTT
eukprot:scaffold111987_cov96-Phaeocystis_antarctica.AAC.2